MRRTCYFVLLVTTVVAAVAQESPTSAPTFEPTFSSTGAPTLKDVAQCHEQDQFVFVRSELVNFTNARQRCKDREGNLARIQNTIEFELVGSMTSGFVAWIGVDALQAREDNNGARNPGTVDFVFTDGVTEGVEFCQGEINQQPWRFDQPDNNSNREDCVGYVSDRTWNDAPCFVEAFYVCRIVEAADCKTDAPTSSPTFEPTSSPLPDISECFERDQFLFVRSEQLVFLEAQDSCVSRGGNLARIQNLEEFNLVTSLVLNDSAWIGNQRNKSFIFLNLGVDALAKQDQRSPGTIDFVFTDGVADPAGLAFIRDKSIAGQPWNSRQPDNNGGREHCVSYFDDRTWNDSPCSFVAPFVCRIVEAPECTPSPTLSPVTSSPTASPVIAVGECQERVLGIRRPIITFSP